jgi:hypothetical protein
MPFIVKNGKTQKAVFETGILIELELFFTKMTALP